MKRRSDFFRAMKLPALLAGTIIAGCSNSGDDDWRLGEKRSVVAKNDELVSGLAASAAQGEFRIPVPLGVERSRIALSGVGKLTIGRDARVIEAAAGDFGTVTAVGGVELGAGAQLGSIYSAGRAPVVLGDKATVNGFIRSASGVQQAATARVDEGIIDRDASQLEELRWQVKFPDAHWGEPVARAGDAAPQDIKPGPYGKVVVETGATAIIHSGAYYIRSLEVQQGAVVEIDNSYGPVYLWVRDGLALNGTLMEYVATKPNVLIGYAGTAAPSIGSTFRGTLVAPAADVELPAGRSNHVGAVFARGVHLADGAVFEHRAFEGADVDYAAAPDYGHCVTVCETQYRTQRVDCSSVYNASMLACGAAYPLCAAGLASVCSPLIPTLWGYAACLAAIPGASCAAGTVACYYLQGTYYTQCSNNVTISYQVCGQQCH